MSTNTQKLATYLLIFLMGIPVGAIASVPTESGDLESYLNDITFGSKDDGRFKIPTTLQSDKFENVIKLILHRNYTLANSYAGELGYELVEFTDTFSSKSYYMLRETNLIPSPLANGGGLYIFRPAASYNVAIHAPHPKSDTSTNKGAISAFMTSDVRYFLMSGSHRRSHPEPSTCQGFSDYRPSDPVHNTAHYFFMAHKAMEDFDNTIHYIELHGYSGDSYDTVVSQCATGGNPAVANISETISDDDASEYTLLHTLESVLNTTGDIKACIYSTILDTGPNDKYTRYLGGSTNTLARYTNGSPSVCNQAAQLANNSHRYLHLEQSWDIRTNAAMRESMAVSIDQAIRNYFDEKPFKINAGLNDAWFNPETDGQGFFITVFPVANLVSLAWFTYDTEFPPADTPNNLGDPGHRWLSALGYINGNQSVMTISIASGGLFDTTTDIDRESDGSITLTFDDCISATVEYDIVSIARKGSVPITRISGDNVPLCEALNKQ